MREIFASIAVVIAIASHVPYFLDVKNGKTKPHLFTWLIWTLIVTIGVSAQIVGHAGAGVWPNVADLIVTFTTLILAIRFGLADIKRFDWICLTGVLIAGGAWIVGGGPFISVILISAIDFLAFAPTFRKSWDKPFEETLITYISGSVRTTLSILAIANFSVITTLYPATLLVTETSFVVMLLIRRRYFSRQNLHREALT